MDARRGGTGQTTPRNDGHVKLDAEHLREGKSDTIHHRVQDEKGDKEPRSQEEQQKTKKIQGHDGKREERQTGLRTRVKKAGIERKGAKETFGESASHHKGGSR